MRPIMFFILLYLMSAFEAARLGSLPFGTNEDWPAIMFLPMLAVFYALFSSESLPLTALGCGIMMDLIQHQLVGTNMIPLALAAWVVGRSRTVIFREHAMAQMVMTFVGLLVFAAAAVVYRKIIGSLAFENGSMWSQFWTMAANALYTALLSPAIYWAIFRTGPLLGFSARRPRRR